MNNKLHCTFCDKDQLENTLGIIKNRYTILYDKIFVLESENESELICTYNIDSFNTNSSILENTILTHRKKEVNCIYSLNSLNLLIKKLNNNILDKSYKINWEDYTNSILLTQKGEFKQLHTKLHSIIKL